MKTDRPAQDFLITFHDVGEDAELVAANKLSGALNCRVVTFKAGQLEHVSTPVTQTRVGFHGDGNRESFGSAKHYLSPIQFATELIKFLKNNPNITDVDLFSCNLGLIDRNGSCYALVVQEYLDANGYGHVNVNTFVVDNRDNSISDSFFIVGLKSDPKSKTLGDNQFSIDVLRKDNTKQTEMNKKLEGLQAELFNLQVQRDLLRSIKGLLSETSSANITIENLRTRMVEQNNYSQDQITQILTKYNVQIHNQDFVTCNIFPNREYTYQKEVKNDIDKLDVAIGKKTSELEEASKQFAELRTTDASTTRVRKDDITQVRKHLHPMRHLISDRLMDRVARLKSPNQNLDSKRMGVLIKNISSTYKGKRLHEDLKKLDIYAGNIADVLLAHKNENKQESNTLKALAIYLGNAYQDCITEGKDVDECIKELKGKVKEICSLIKTDYKEKETSSLQGSGTTFQSSSLSQQLFQAINKSDEAMAKLSTQFRKETALAH